MQDYEQYYRKILHCKGIKKNQLKNILKPLNGFAVLPHCKLYRIDSGEKEKTKIGLFAVK